MTLRPLAPLILASTLASQVVAAAAYAAEAPDDPDAGRFAATVAQIEALPEAELKKFYLRCSRAAVRGRISSGEIALCSVGYERLLKRSFGGDFKALLEWRRNPNRDQEPASPGPF